MVERISGSHQIHGWFPGCLRPECLNHSASSSRYPGDFEHLPLAQETAQANPPFRTAAEVLNFRRRGSQGRIADLAGLVSIAFAMAMGDDGFHASSRLMPSLALYRDCCFAFGLAVSGNRTTRHHGQASQRTLIRSFWWFMRLRFGQSDSRIPTLACCCDAVCPRQHAACSRA